MNNLSAKKRRLFGHLRAKIVIICSSLSSEKSSLFFALNYVVF